MDDVFVNINFGHHNREYSVSKTNTRQEFIQDIRFSMNWIQQTSLFIFL